VLTLPEINQLQLISWQLAQQDEPRFTGLKLTSKKLIYLEPPTFWYPPVNQTLNLNVLVEDITARSIIARTIETLSPHNKWIGIKLSQWITAPGCYEARFWFDEKRWSYRFEVKSKEQSPTTAPFNEIRISSNSGIYHIDLPIKHEHSDKFWSEAIAIEGLWPLEEIVFYLSNQSEKIQQLMQADVSGILRIDLSILHDLLPHSNWYALDYQRLGLEPQRLVEMQSLPHNISCNWTSQAVYLSGLHSDKLYSLSCWNLLLPNSEPKEIKIPLIDYSKTTIEVPLNLPTGIYYIQLVSSQLLPVDLGCWCGSGKNDLSENLSEDEENYCYTVLGNTETKEAFIDAVEQLNLDFNYQHLQKIINALENDKYYFPDWLNKNSLLAKLKALLKFLREPNILPLPQQQKMPPIQPIQPSSPAPISGNWYLVSVRAKKREAFLKFLNIDINKNNLKELILDVKIPQDAVYEDIVLLNLSNFKAASSELQKIEHFQSVQRKPLTLEEVSRMISHN
jgi:hypothetical protein